MNPSTFSSPRSPVTIGNRLRRLAASLGEKGLELATGIKVGKLRTRIIEISRIGGLRTKWVGPATPVPEELVMAAAAVGDGPQASPEVAAPNTSASPSVVDRRGRRRGRDTARRGARARRSRTPRGGERADLHPYAA
jgi:hypothetical protein